MSKAAKQSLGVFFIPMGVVIPVVLVSFFMLISVDCEAMLTMSDEEYTNLPISKDHPIQQDGHKECTTQVGDAWILFATIPLILGSIIIYTIYSVRKYNKGVKDEKN